MVRQVMSKHFGRKALALLALAAITAAALAGELNPSRGGKKKIEAKVTAKADKPAPDGMQKVVVTMEVNPTWYAYANPVGNEDFATNATVIKVKRPRTKVDNVKIAYPPGKTKKDTIVGNYNIYEGKIEIPLTLQRTKGDTSPLEVSVQFMTCNVKGVCLPVQDVCLRSEAHCAVSDRRVGQLDPAPGLANLGPARCKKAGQHGRSHPGGVDSGC